MGTRDFNFIDKIVAFLRLRKVNKFVDEGNSILDFGCGSQAYLLRKFQDKISFGIGLDYDADSQNISKKIEIRNFKFVDKFGFKDKTFDKIFMLAVLEHIPLDIVEKLYKEFNRVLKPGGKIIFTTPTPMSKPILEFLAFKLKIISAAEINDHKKYYAKSDIEELGKKTGFKLTKYKNFQFGINSLSVFEKK